MAVINTRSFRLTQGSPEPITLAQLKLHMRIDSSAEDALLTASIIAAREYCESMTQRALVTSTWRALMDRFPAGREPIILQHGSVSAISSLKYIDAKRDTITWASTNYALDDKITPCRIRLDKANDSWPTTDDTEAAVEVNYTVTPTVPTQVTQAMLLLCGHWYENRETVVVGATSTKIEMATKALLDSVRLGSLS